MVSDRAFVFHIYISWVKALSLVPKSRSSVKVKDRYQGHGFWKNGHCWGIRVSQTDLVYLEMKHFPVSSRLFKKNVADQKS